MVGLLVIGAKATIDFMPYNKNRKKLLVFCRKEFLSMYGLIQLLYRYSIAANAW